MSVDEKLLSLIFLLDTQTRRVLLGLKKRGFGQGKMNGFGGKMESGETMAECACRELEEESGCKVQVERVQARGRLHFDMLNDSGMVDKRTGRIIPRLLVYVYTAELADSTGVVTESDEMQPQWCSWDEIPLDRMWPDDAFWLPKLLAGNDIVGHFEFANQQDIVRHNVLALPRGAYAEDSAKHEAAVALDAAPAVRLPAPPTA